MMEIRRIKASELIEFANNTASIYEGSIPITPWRAESQVNNPFVNPDDILLIVAQEGSKLLGYIGILPGIAGGDLKKTLYWISCWWAAKGTGAKVSMTLLLEFMKITGKRIAFSDLTERTKQIIEKLGFKINERKGVILNIRSGLHSRLLFKKKTDLKMRILISLRYFGLFQFLDLFLDIFRPTRFNYKNIMDNIDNQKLRLPDEESYSIINKYSQKGITIPSEKHFKWWLSYPWLVEETREKRAVSETYHFSSLRKSFELYLIKVKEGKEIIGVAILSCRDGVVKTHYLYYVDEKKTDFFHSLFLQITGEPVNHRIVTFHEEFSEFIKAGVKSKHSIKNIVRYTALSSIISEGSDDYHFQDGDGDYIFT